DYGVEFVGHPLIDAINNRTAANPVEFRREHNLDERPIIALLPGSRKQEITKLLTVMLTAVRKFPDYQFVIAGAPGQDYVFYKQFIDMNDVKFISNQTYDLLAM